MKAILIDPIAQTFTEVEHNDDFRQIYVLLSDPENGLNVDDFNVVNLDQNEPVMNSLFVDGEGLLKDPRYFMVVKGYAQPLAGRGLILGCNEAGESVSTTLTVKEVRKRVKFTQLSVKGFDEYEGETVHPVFGKTHVIGQRPVFGPPKLGDNDA